jgi:hypothetical protein
VRIELSTSEARRVESALADTYGGSHVETLASTSGSTTLLVTTRERRAILPEISQRAQKEQWKLDGLHVEHGRLDEVFHDLTRVGARN